MGTQLLVRVDKKGTVSETSSLHKRISKRGFVEQFLPDISGTIKRRSRKTKGEVKHFKRGHKKR